MNRSFVAKKLSGSCPGSVVNRIHLKVLMVSWYINMVLNNCERSSPLPKNCQGVAPGLWWIGYTDHLNWKRFVAAACESRQSGTQSWRTVDGLLWTFFNWVFNHDDTCTHIFIYIYYYRHEPGDGGIDLSGWFRGRYIIIQCKVTIYCHYFFQLYFRN